MALPWNSKEILVLRQGTATPTYDENSRQNNEMLVGRGRAS